MGPNAQSILVPPTPAAPANGLDTGLGLIMSLGWVAWRGVNVTRTPSYTVTPGNNTDDVFKFVHQ